MDQLEKAFSIDGTIEGNPSSEAGAPDHGVESLSQTFRWNWEYIESQALIRVFIGTVRVSSSIEIDFTMNPNPHDRWRHDPELGGVDLELELLRADGSIAWERRHGIGHLTCQDSSRVVWRETIQGGSFEATEVVTARLSIWRVRFIRC